MELRLSILLGRVSTDDQKTVPMQLDELRSAALSKGETIVEELTEHHSVSTDEFETDWKAYIKRIPKLNYLFELADKQKKSGVIHFNKLWVWKWDRFSRDTAFAELMVRHLKMCGIECESLAEGTNQFTRRVHNALAQEEIETKRKRVALGQARQFKDRWPMSRAPFGYFSDKNIKNFVVLEEEAKKYHQIVRGFLKGSSLSALSKEHGMSIPALKYLLQNKTYLGQICFSGKWGQGRHKALIDQETFDKVQSKINDRINKFPKYLQRHGTASTSD